VVLIYDGACGFCRRSVRWARALGADCPAVPYQEVDLVGYGVTRREAADAAWFVRGSRRWRGHEAVAMALRSSRFVPVRWAGLLLGTRFVSPVASRAYEWVAANRGRLP
jgi:predicted DCC family thiol-disulfide oxidoreductase YuxK